MSDPKNLPHKAIIKVGPELLDLLITALYDKDGKYMGPMLTWDVVTEKVKADTEMARFNNMIQNAPINIMLADLDFNLTYLNPKSKDTLRTIQQYLPKPVDQLEGQSIDIFHKNPSHQRKILGDPNNLPHRAKIKVGPETLDLLVSPLFDNNNKYLGPMVTWDVITQKLGLVETLTNTSNDLASSSEELLSVSSSMTKNSEQTSDQATAASASSEQVSTGVQTVATSMEEMTASIKEITKSTNESSSMSNEATQMAKSANDIITQLGESSLDIGNVIKVISSIAQQTNLLALNATIEAARAGEAGKGFAVVANEVKELAKETANATADITKKIEAIQGDSKGAVDAIDKIGKTIEKLNNIAGTIASAVEEQAATTTDVSRVVQESSESVKGISKNVIEVNKAAKLTSEGCAQTQDAANTLNKLAASLKDLVKQVEV